MPTDSTSTETVFRRSVRSLLDKDISAWSALWAEHGVLEFPFAPDGWPDRVEGKTAIAEYMRHYPDHIDLQDFPDVHVRQTDEPRTIVVEMRGVGRIVDTNAPFDARYIAVVTVEQGLIVSYRDYWNPLMVQEPGVDFFRSS